MVDFLTKYLLLLVGAMAAMAWVFVGRLAWTRWWESREGRYLMKSKTALALIFTMGLLFRVFEPSAEVRAVVASLLYTWIAYTLAELLVLQTRARRDRNVVDSEDRDRLAKYDAAADNEPTPR
jgi:hypothetical protein